MIPKLMTLPVPLRLSGSIDPGPGVDPLQLVSLLQYHNLSLKSSSTTHFLDPYIEVVWGLGAHKWDLHQRGSLSLCYDYCLYALIFGIHNLFPQQHITSRIFKLLTVVCIRFIFVLLRIYSRVLTSITDAVYDPQSRSELLSR